jgi:hypothetical protein
VSRSSALSPSDDSASSGPSLRPLVVRTRGSAIQAVYGLILATSVIAVSYDTHDAGRVGSAVLVTAVVFWLAHVYAYLLGRDVVQARRPSAEEVGNALREHGSLVQAVLPLVLVLGLGAVGAVPDRAALLGATVIALVELAAAGGYAAARGGAGLRGTAVSAGIAPGLGLVIVLLKALVH